MYIVDKLDINAQSQGLNTDKDFFQKTDFEAIAERVYYIILVI